MPNRLADESSPYLLQHANNPVDWYPWSEEALEKSKSEDKPIFLSIGYSACHWCHVMEHESFEDQGIAEFLNENYISIKVDREERPDLDHIYMQSVMALRGGQGGWPLSAFLTPKKEVFFGGTYWPPHARAQMPGFDSVIRQVLQAYQQQRENIEDQASRVTQWLVDSFAKNAAGSQSSSEESSGEIVDPEILNHAAQQLESSFDFENGGFGSAPKFPHPMDLQLLLRLAKRANSVASDDSSPTNESDGLLARSAETMLKMVRLNLDKMAYGGIHDHLGGGFARYSVDEKWLVPHFEKMLYDNAQLIRVYSEAYCLTGQKSFLRFAEKTIDYLLRDMLDKDGGFHSSEDADSEGVEGKFYVWTKAEILECLGQEKGERFCSLYDVTDYGNFEGNSILNMPVDFETFATKNQLAKDELQTEMRESREKLRQLRDNRIRPGKDDKVLTSWNALAIDALSFYALIHPEAEYAKQTRLKKALAECTRFATGVRDDADRLLHSYRQGQKKIHAFLDDYSYLINALLTYSTLDWQNSTDHIDTASKLATAMVEQFEDTVNGGFYFTPCDQSDVITRFKDHHDGSVPSGNAMAAFALIRLGRMTGKTTWIDKAEKTIRWALPTVKRNTIACGQMLLAIDLLLAEPVEVIVVIPNEAAENADSLDFVRAVQSTWLPHASVVFVNERDSGDAADKQMSGTKAIDSSVLRGKKVMNGKPTAYICQNYQCEQPITELDELIKRLSDLD